MNMRKTILAIAALAFMAWGCSSSGDDEPTPTSTPTPSEITAGTDARPTTWTPVNYDLYEGLMSVNVVLQDTLQQYASSADMMCATINGEVRGVCTEGTTEGGAWMFAMTVGANETDAVVSLSYYCDKLHRIFTIDQWTTFDANRPPTGEGAVYTPEFVFTLSLS